jgi:hypothetical protein
MPNQQPQQQVEDRMASPAEVAEAQRTMIAIRKLIAQFHDTRRRNNEMAAGLRRAKVTPDQARMILAQTRDPQLESQAVDALRQYLSILHGREPSRQEMQHGIPNGTEQQLGLGVWPYVVMVGLGAAGTSVYSYFQAAAERERTAQMAMETPIDRVLRLARENTTALTVAGALGAGAYWYHQKQKGSPAPSEDEAEETPKANPEGITERIKAAFVSKKETAKENPDVFFRYDLEDFDSDTLRKMAEHLEATAEEKCDDTEEDNDEEVEVEAVEEPEEEAQEEEAEEETEEDDESKES